MTHAPELRAALGAAVAVALRELAAVEATPGGPGPAADGSDVTAVLPVHTAAGEGFFALRLGAPAAAALARRVLGAACPDPDPGLVRDALGEVLNVIAGQAKTLLRGTPFYFALGTPGPAEPPAPGAALRLPFVCACGPLALDARLPT